MWSRSTSRSVSIALLLDAAHEPEEPHVDPAALASLVAGARGRLDRLAARVATLRPAEASREDQAGVVLLLDQLDRLVAQARRLVDELAVDAATEPALAIEHLSTIRLGVGAIERACAYDLGALGRVPQRDFEPLVGPFTELARTVSGRRETELVFEATESFMYRVHADAFEDVREQLHYLNAAPFSDPVPTILEGLPRLALIAYPVRADEDTLSHAVVAHEVAHLAMSRPTEGDTSLREMAFERVTADPEMRRGDSAGEGSHEAHTRPALDPIPSSSQRPENAAVDVDPPLPANADPRQASQAADTTPASSRSGEGSDRPSKRLKNWLDELSCDLLAIRMMGPAYFFALVEFAQPSAQVDHVPNSPGYDTHPSVVWRLQRMRKETESFLDRDLDSEAMRAVIRVFDEFSGFVELQDEFTLKNISPQEQDERERVLRGVALIEERATGLLGHARFTRHRFVRDLDLVWSKLNQGIAPVERIRGRAMPEGADLELPVVGPEPNVPVPEGEPPEPPEPIAGDWSRPFDWRSILNGCYAFHLSGASSHLEGETRITPERRRADSQMCRGSIELAEYLRRMLILRDQFRQIDILVEP